MKLCPITCPSCYETFFIHSPPPAELPVELDYDCEVCCHPMWIIISSDSSAHARSLDD